MFDILVNTRFPGDDTGNPGDPSNGTTFAQLVVSDPPTRVQVERLAQERWHTRPDWWIEKRAPKVVGIDALPSEFSYNSAENRITVSASGGTLDGWDFAATATQVYLVSGDDIAAISNCKFAPQPISKSERLSAAPEAPLRFLVNTNGRIRVLHKCWFTVADGHGGGAWSPNALILAQNTDGTNYPLIDLMSFCSFEGYGQDAVKGLWIGKREGCFFDCAWNVPEDATEWQSGTTYNRGDVVYNASTSYWMRICRNDGVTSAPNWSSKLASTTDWDFVDPHSDTDQRSGSAPGVAEWNACFFHRDQDHRRHPSRQFNRGVVNALRLIPNNPSQRRGSELIHNCIFTAELEIANSNTEAITTAAASAMRPGATVTIRDNWHSGALGGGSAAHLSVTGNQGGWSWWSGASVSGIAASYGTSTSTLSYAFTASIGGWMTVVVNGSATPLTAAQIIAARTGSGGVLAKFEIDAEAGSAALGFGDLALSSGQTVYAHGLYQAGGGVDTLAPVQPVTEGEGTSNTFSLNTLPFDGYVFDRNGQATAEVILTGEGAAGDIIQCRGESAGGNTQWASTTVANDGTWQVSMQVPQAQWGNWYVPAARIGTANNTKLTGANTFGCGDVIGFLGQSELQHWLDGRAGFNRQPKEIADDNLSVVLGDDSVKPNIVTTARVTAANMGGVSENSPVNIGTLSMANAIARAAPDRKIMVVDLADSGSSPFSLWNDSDGDRTWTDFVSIVNLVQSGGSDLGAVMMYWVAAPRASLDQMLNNWAPGMFGQRASGAAFTLGSVNTEAENAFRIAIDHCFWDIEADPDARGRGVFARNRTKLYINHLGIGNDASNTSPALEYEAVTSGANANTPQRMNAEIAAQRAFVADPRVQTFFGGWGAKWGLANFDENNTGVAANYGEHPNRDVPLGTPQAPMGMVPGILRHMGVASALEPRITGFETVNATTIDVLVDLPNGGNLTTLRELTGEAFTLTPQPPQQQVVTGFQIERSGTKRPIMRSAETGFSASQRGTVTIQDSGSGTVPNRTGRIRIVFDQAIASGDRLTWADGLTLPALAENETLAHMWMDYPVEHVPAWYDASALYPYYGEPIVPQPAPLAVG